MTMNETAPRKRRRTGADTPADEQRIAANLVIDGRVKQGQATEIAGGSVQVVKTSVAYEAGRRAMLAELQIDPETLAMSAKTKLAVATKKMERRLGDAFQARMRQLDQEVHERVMAETASYRATLEELQAQARTERDHYQDLVNGHQPILTLDQWTLLRRVAHPDNSASDKVRALAFRLIEDKKLQLTGVKP